MSTAHLLDNILWHSLTGPLARWAYGTSHARRLPLGFTPVLAFADPQQPDWAGLDSLCAVGEHFYCLDGESAPPPGWEAGLTARVAQYVWDSPPPVPNPHFTAVRLGSEHLPAILELVAVATPGPFGPRCLELGEFYGHCDGDTLIALAGERFAAGPLAEISTVCTHPAYRGEGRARQLVESLVRLQLQREQQPYLHVMEDNTAARRLYERIGFRLHRITPLQIVARKH